MPKRPHTDAWPIYEQAFRSLLWRMRAERRQLGVNRLRNIAERLMASGMAPDEALQLVYSRLRVRVIRKLVRRRAAAKSSSTGTTNSLSSERRLQQMRELLEVSVPKAPVAECPDFHCDAALGGLARWLRATGYDAAWWPGIEDDHLIRKVQGTTAMLLTTDRRLMQRGMIQWGVVPALLIPISMKKRDQFALAASKLRLERKDPRCMQCGGALRPVAKQAVRDRIPPRTYPWRDDYFLCQRCGKLFWKGTHWQRIEPELEKLSPSG